MSHPPPLEINCTNIKKVENFIYLGSNISGQGTLDMEIANRLHKASHAFGGLYHRVWKNNNIHLGTKLAIYQAVVLSVLLYGWQTWVPYQRHVAKLKSFHHRCLRTIIGIRWQQMLPNTTVLKRAGCDSITGLLGFHRLQWLGHVQRLADHRIPKRLLSGELNSGNDPSTSQRKDGKTALHQT